MRERKTIACLLALLFTHSLFAAGQPATPFHWFENRWAFLFYAFLGSVLLYTWQKYKAKQTRLAYDKQVQQLTAEKEQAERQRMEAVAALTKTEKEKNDALIEAQRMNQRLLNLADQLQLFAGQEGRADGPAEGPELWADIAPMAPLVAEQERQSGQTVFNAVATENQRILIVDDNADIRRYIAKLFNEQFTVYEAPSGEEGLVLARQFQPDIIISDVFMPGMTGIEFCKIIKDDNGLGHIPVILLSGSGATDTRLQGVESGADDYITKPFDKDLLVARVIALIKSKNNLQKYFYNEITLQQNPLKVSAEYKAFLDNCIAIVETHLDDDQFSIQALAHELGMSYSKMNKKIKAVCGQPANAFVRFIRLRKAAELFINSNYNINETAYQVGMGDIKHFREHFTRLFGMKPSEYIEKYRKNFGKQYNINEQILRRVET
ncbi:MULTISPECIES: response regulator [Niastella]|uniref:Response regulator n=1 Tax=Niastella soli TaxID=2821487 RepID=A0ABS3Z3Z9_9BACT|nr:response regulator [Niastella soli]MBO9204462.1 response regulator [Niastella soli]